MVAITLASAAYLGMVIVVSWLLILGLKKDTWSYDKAFLWQHSGENEITIEEGEDEDSSHSAEASDETLK